MKYTAKEFSLLVKGFKQLVEDDTLGITVTDARNTITNWLEAVGESEGAKEFEAQVYNYQSSPKVQKMWEDSQP